MGSHRTLALLQAVSKKRTTTETAESPARGDKRVGRKRDYGADDDNVYVFFGGRLRRTIELNSRDR